MKTSTLERGLIAVGTKWEGKSENRLEKLTNCHVFDSNELHSGTAHKSACSKCIGRWPKTPQLLPTS